MQGEENFHICWNLCSLFSLQPNNPGQSPQGNETEGSHGNATSQSQGGNNAPSGQTFSSQPFQTLPQFLQTPLAAGASPFPSLNTVLLNIFWHTWILHDLDCDIYMTVYHLLSLFSPFQMLWTLSLSLWTAWSGHYHKMEVNQNLLVLSCRNLWHLLTAICFM